MALVDLARRVSVSLFLLLGVMTPPAAWAGDSAQFSALGYSANGQFFAFEQFGIQDGSGFPYSEIFIIDLDTDSFVSGSPFQVRIDNEVAELSDARSQALILADGALEKTGISRPALPIALRGDGNLNDEGLAISYGIPSYGLARTEGQYQLEMDIFKAPSPRDCDYFEGNPMAFALRRMAEGTVAEIYRDTRVPASRGCVITYKFYGIFNPFEAYDNASSVAVISVWSHGFEGPDRRFIAVPVGER